MRNSTTPCSSKSRDMSATLWSPLGSQQLAGEEVSRKLAEE